MRTFHLWLDFETTGLIPQMDTILESAWTITDHELTMLTPLRSRLCVIDPPARRQNAAHIPHPLGGISEFQISDRDADNGGDWFRLDQVVQNMHEMSGLRGALEHATADPVEAQRMLTTAHDLERLLKEDLADVGYDHTVDSLVLSGAGVSHFDNRVLGQHLPDMFPLGGHGRNGYAYWQYDVSVAKRALGELWEVLGGIRDELPEQSSTYHCQALLSNRHQKMAPMSLTIGFDGRAFFMPKELVAHRAADDVVAALIDGRILLNARQLLKEIYS